MNLLRLKPYLVCMTIIFFIGCGRKINFNRFPAISQADSFIQSKADVTAIVQVFDDERSKEYFGVALVSAGYVPLHVCIQNNSAQPYVIRPSYVSLKPVEISEVAKKLHYNTSLFVYGAGIPALLFWWPATIWVVHEGYDMYQTNKKIDALVDQQSLSLQNEVIIYPYETFERFMFVATQEYKPWFNMSLYGMESKELLTFDVRVYKKGARI